VWTKVVSVGLSILILRVVDGGAFSEPVIERNDPRFDRLIAPEAKVEKIVDGLTWLEGPVWDPRENCLYFSEIPRNTVHRWKEYEGVRPYLTRSGYTGAEPYAGREPGSNGLTIDAQGRLILCEHGDRRVTRLEADGKKTTLADQYQGRRLNSPNDVTFAAEGDLYFTDPPFGLPKAFDDAGRELDFCGVYRIARDGTVTLLTKEVPAPNGLAFSPGGDVLYVSNADRSRPVWFAFPVTSNGTLGPARVFADASRWVNDRSGGPDGIKVDREGNVFTAGPGGIYVFSPDGAHWGTILLHTATSNCAWGQDGSVLFITAGASVYRIATLTRGVARP
jgi:gluconolactonase